MSERLKRVEQDDVQISMNSPMLEPIIQDDEVAIMVLDRPASGGHAIGILQMRYLGKSLGQFPPFIVWVPTPCRSPGGTIAATNQCHLRAAPREPSGEPSDHGRLTGAAGGDIPHADNGHPDTMHGPAPGIESSISTFNGGGIRNLHDSQQPAQEAGSEPTAVAADQCLEFRGVVKRTHATRIHSPYIDCEARGFLSHA